MSLYYTLAASRIPIRIIYFFKLYINTSRVCVCRSHSK